jgi:hypothetical protein
MSTALAERTSKPSKALKRFPCKYNRAVIDLGIESISLGFSISKEFLSPQEADEFFSGHSVSVRIVAGDGDPDQQTFWKGAAGDVEATAVVKGFRCGAKKISSSLIISAEGMPSDETKVLKRYAKKTGWMFILKAEELEADDEEEGEDEQEGEDKEAGDEQDENE